MQDNSSIIGSSAVPSAAVALPPGHQSAPREKERFDKVLGAFTGPIKRVHVSPFYYVGLFVTAFMMLLMPLVYLGLIGLMGYAVYYHGANHLSLIDIDDSARGRIFGMFLYALPIVAGAIVIVFMIKPLFARFPREFSTIDLDPKDEPLLFAFVEKVCKSVRAPVPRVIRVSSEVNASASFRRGFFSFLGGDLVLTIGLPLVAGLNTRELAGVLAHEFGHFAQGLGMRLSYTIRSINMWFARVVYQRDTWDEWLKRTSTEIDIRLGIFLLVARLATWINRIILSILMHIAHAISCFMSRQMEYDADIYQARLSGSDVFDRTMRQIHTLGAASQAVEYELYQFWKEGRLADDLGRLIHDTAEDFPQAIRDKITNHIDNSRTGLFDTHPSPRARLKAAKKQNAEGVFQLEIPATELFKDHTHAARITSLMFYRAVIGDSVHPERLVAAQQLSRERSQKSEEQLILDRFLLKSFNAIFPMPVPETSINRPADPRETLKQIMEARDRMATSIDPTHALVRQYAQAYNQLCGGMMARALLGAGFTLKAGAFGLNSPSKESANQAQYTAEAEMQRLRDNLGLFVSDAHTRLIGGLQLLHDRNVQARINDPEISVEAARELWRVLWRLSEGFHNVDQLRRAFVTARVVVNAYQEHNADPDLGYNLQRKMKELYQPLKSLYFIYKEEPYPFEAGLEGGQRITIGRYLIGTLPSSEVSPETFENSNRAIESFYTLYFRVLGRLCAIAEKVERVIGLQPLAPPVLGPLDDLNE